MTQRRSPPHGHQGGYTILVVPDKSLQDVRQIHVTSGRLRMAKTLAASAAVMVVLLMVSVGLLWSRIWGYDELVHENLALRQRLESIDQQLERVDDALRRVRLYDTQIRHLSKDAELPGFGPMDPVEQERWDRLWGADAPELPVERPELPSFEQAVSHPNTDEVGSVDIRPAELWAQAVETHAAHVVTIVDDMEPRMSSMLQDLEDWRSYRASLPAIWPVHANVGSGFGYRRSPISRRWVFHKGIDLGCPRGTPISAVAPGVVTFSAHNAGYGRMIDIDHGYGISTRYAHNTSNYVQEGDVVDVGEIIGMVGSTGRSTGPHLHFELHIDGQAVDPMEYMP